MTPSQRAMAGRIGSAIARSRHAPADLTASGRAAFLARFEREARETSPNLSDAEVQRRAKELRRAFMTRLALQSSIARGKKRAAAP
jgi:hypothetical protein